jgi:transposase
MLLVRYSLTLFNLFEFEQNVRKQVIVCYPEYPLRRKNEGRFFTFISSVKSIEMNKKIVKQVAGIDVSQKELVVTVGRMYDDWSPEMYATKGFVNTPKGFESMLSWVTQQTVQDVSVRYVMEATGVYHERLAYYLFDKDYELSIVLPNKISNYHRTLEVKTVTDHTSSETITRFGLERKLDRWVKPKELFRKLRQLVRERNQVVAMRTVAKNQLHAEESEAEPGKSSISRLKKQIALFDKQEQEIKKELASIIKTDDKVKQSVSVMSSIPGVGTLTAATVLAETNGFELVHNKRQLSSYAGLDVVEKQSGTSIKSKPKISKKGNKHLRKALHLPALSAIRNSDRYKAIFERLVVRHGVKMKAAVAVQRRLLELMYILYKTNTPYDKNYLNNNTTGINNQEAA